MLKQKVSNEKGFTMIELIMVIVILGILAAVAVPRFVDMQTEAKESSADGVLAAAEAACAINFAANMVGKGLTLVTDGASLLGAMDDTPKGWTAGTTTATQICLDDDSDNDCDGSDTYIITVSAVEDGDSKAVLTKSW